VLFLQGYFSFYKGIRKFTFHSGPRELNLLKYAFGPCPEVGRRPLGESTHCNSFFMVWGGRLLRQQTFQILGHGHLFHVTVRERCVMAKHQHKGLD
jgi:hypothetical protein